ncbi:MAG: 4Fe-4S dicluster domain-containing protein [Hydrogenothermaceae bacterium]|nr:4Fe-4S dicluster domain-containing protein [Hydrogenothermaceae bacterium]
MAFKIVSDYCLNCTACQPLCPNGAIFQIKIKNKEGEEKYTFYIDPYLCNECEGFYEQQQCWAICPIDNTCIKDRSF